MVSRLWITIFIVFSVLLLSPGSFGETKSLKNAFIINEDDSHYFSSREAGKMNLEGLHAFIDQYAGTAVTHLFLCPNAQRASFRSQTREAIWDPVDGKDPSGRWPDNARLLNERGLDLYKIWIARCREKGISPWLSMRMNDLHEAQDLKSFLHTSFWREHPEFWRIPNGSGSPWQNRAENYAHKEVRDHHKAFVKELLERYDPDGLELDWIRFGWHLTPGKEKEEGKYITEFMRETRKLTNEWAAKRGHPILLGVRVPAHPDAASGLGMDGVLWAKEGLIDLLVPCPFWSTSDFDIPVELWKERLGDTTKAVLIAPGLEFNARPWPGGKAVANTLNSAYGFASSALYRGADALYLFNWMDSETIPVSDTTYRTLLEKGLNTATTSKAIRRYPVCYRDTVPDKFPNGIVLPMETTNSGEFKINIGPKPTAGTTWIIAGLAKRDRLKDTTFEAKINDASTPPAEELKEISDIGGDPAQVIRFKCPKEAIKDGYNFVSIQQNPGTPSQQIVWIEMRVEPEGK